MKKPKHTSGGPRIAAAALALRVDKKAEVAHTRKAQAKQAAPMKDDAYDRNFTKSGTPRLSATSGSGSMGQRR